MKRLLVTVALAFIAVPSFGAIQYEFMLKNTSDDEAELPGLTTVPDPAYSLYGLGGAKFDLHRFDEAYVARLRDVLTEASARGIIVELVLFCPLYEDSMWAVSPMNPANNVKGVPLYLINGRETVSGAQAPSVFAGAIERALRAVA